MRILASTVRFNIFKTPDVVAIVPAAAVLQVSDATAN